MNEENLKITREKMIEFVCKVWYDEYIITKEMINNSFICTGIIYDKNQKEGLSLHGKKCKMKIQLLKMI